MINQEAKWGIKNTIKFGMIYRIFVQNLVNFL
jgi:hypothetical protein